MNLKHLSFEYVAVCLATMTFAGAHVFERTGAHKLPLPDPVEHADTVNTTNWTHGYRILFEDGQGNVLACAPTHPDFFAEDQEWGTFVQRLPYHRQTARVVLRKGSKEIGVLNVTQKLPDFVLHHPIQDERYRYPGYLASSMGSKIRTS